MKRTTHIIIFAIAIFAFMASAYALSTREELAQRVEQLQKSPTDNALREKIIKLAQVVKPAPAIPEEARRYFVRAVTLQKDAKNANDYMAAVAEYRQALAIAPWWSDVYFNLSAVLDAAGQFEEASKAMNFYLASNPSEADARSARDRLYAMEARHEKEDRITKEQAQAVALAEQRKELLDKLRGIWVMRYCGQNGQGCTDSERHGSSWYELKSSTGPEGIPWTAEFGFSGDGSVLMDNKMFHTGWAGNSPDSVGPVSGVLNGTTYNDIVWEGRPKSGGRVKVYAEIGFDGSWITISCDRPLTGERPDARYHYLSFYRPK